MAPKRATSTRAKRASGLAQGSLSFQTRKPGIGGKKALSQSPSLASLQAASEASGAEDVDVTKPAIKKAESIAKDSTVSGGKEARRQLNVKSKEWEKVKKAAYVEMGPTPIHAGPDTHNDVHHILRVFDMTARYGPCVGVTRLQRWERAKKWGLSPPEEIKLILTTEQGEDDQVYRENVLYTWLG